MNCALFDKSTNFGTTYYEQIWMWSHRPTAPWRPWRPFSKMAASGPADIQMLDKVCR